MIPQGETTRLTEAYFQISHSGRQEKLLSAATDCKK